MMERSTTSKTTFLFKEQLMTIAKATRLNSLAKEITTWASEKGFWDKPAAMGEAAGWIEQHQKATKIALVHSELSELLEEIRKPAPTQLAGFTNEEEEVADTLIRLLDYAGHYKLDIAGAVAAKMEVNLGRPHKHGKAF